MLCLFSHQFPRTVEHFLDRDRALKRRFREETVTDMLMGGLMTLGGRRVMVEFPNEARTGADMEWNFVNERTGRFFRILVQAKRSFVLSNDPAKPDFHDWRRHSYRELYHRTGSSSDQQAVVLCNEARSAAATYPLYAFYNAGVTRALAEFGGQENVQGVSLADGYAIEQVVRGATTGAPGYGVKTHNKRVGAIAPYLRPFSALFCPSRVQQLPPFAFAPRNAAEFFLVSSAEGIGVPMPPTPDDVRERVVTMQDEAIGQADGDLPPVPVVADRIPEDVQELLGKRDADGINRLKRWRVTFVSSETVDDTYEGG